MRRSLGSTLASTVFTSTVRTARARLWYAEKSLEHGWSRSVLTMQIETAAHARAGNAVTNFADRLPPPQSDLARDALKDPYIFVSDPLSPSL